MIHINPHYAKLKSSYLFAEIARRVNDFQKANPDREIIRLGIGDVTEPLPPACIAAMHRAVDELGSAESFRGYGPEQGYPFLREAIAENDFQSRGADIDADEIFVSDGAKCDTGNIQELFQTNLRVAVPDPVYPVYVDTNVMAGRTGTHVDGRYSGLAYLPCTPENAYVPALPDQPVDLIYLCFPNNPTGAVASREILQQWVDFAREHQALILFDAAYEAFINTPDVPHSIYEIPGARDVAIEFRSFSKTAGFTGTRCAFTVVPKTCMAWDESGSPQSLHALWNRRQSTKFNGVSYPVQRAAEAVYTDEGKSQTAALIKGYQTNAQAIRSGMQALGFNLVGGEHSPYVWVRTGGDDWDLFDRLLNKASVVTTPGSGFGRCGKGHIRISAFNSAANVQQAMSRIQQAMQ